ncbi:hypothetical protein GCM10011574_43910 [Microbispora bryophytorum]|uniref:Uncharacterized protein n=1 Tax=Microbispora bryophytorum TaxID=1460882 RepID=A0A8H9LBD5_9ACTN|nr:hypothetical protein GCM10011574_43910 [Microbispora bryophytorum]
MDHMGEGRFVRSRGIANPLAEAVWMQMVPGWGRWAAQIVGTDCGPRGVDDIGHASDEVGAVVGGGDQRFTAGRTPRYMWSGSSAPHKRVTEARKCLAASRASKRPARM